MSDTTPPERVKVVFAQNGNIRLFTTGDIPASLAELPVYEYVRSDCNADCVSGLDCDALIKQAVADAVIASEARAAAAERERDELRAAQQWQPIETAPRDGSEILIIAGTAYSPKARVGWWVGSGFAFLSRPDEFWSVGVKIMLEATHWQPLPAPPQPR